MSYALANFIYPEYVKVKLVLTGVPRMVLGVERFQYFSVVLNTDVKRVFQISEWVSSASKPTHKLHASEERSIQRERECKRRRSKRRRTRKRGVLKRDDTM